MDDARWDWLISGLRTGDPRAVGEFCKRYGPRLERLADGHLARGPLRRRVSPESVVQSACRTFLRRAGEGQFEVADPDGLWRLLCAITLTKVREQVRFHGQQKRQLGREVHPDGPDDRFAHEPGGEPSALDAVIFAETLEHVIASLQDDEERRVVELRLQDLGTQEAAAELGCSERTVRRILARVRARLEGVLQTV